MDCFRRLCNRIFNRQDRPDEFGAVETKDTNLVSPVGSSEAAAGIENNNNNNHEYAEYGLPSPPRGENAKSAELSKKQMRKDGFGKYTRRNKRGRNKSKVLFFLYGRGFCIDESKRERVKKVNCIIRNEEALERAVRLVTHNGDTDITAKQVEVYKALCKTLEAYFAQEGAFQISVPSSSVPLNNYFRFQQQGKCFLLAPCVFLSYLMQHKGITDHGPLDLTQYVRHAFTDDKLYRYLTEDDGGSTVTELRSILQSLSSDEKRNILHSPNIDYLDNKTHSDALERLLEQNGPGIVSNFKVFKGFDKSEYPLEHVGYMRFTEAKHLHKKGTFIEVESAHSTNGDQQPRYEVTLAQYLEDHPTPKKLSFPASGSNDDASENEGDDKKNDEGIHAHEDALQDGKGYEIETHAMVVIGGRRTNNKLFILLQNWWESMQLVEVSADYLSNCGAQIHFVCESFQLSPSKIGQGYSLNASLVADANNFDRAERVEGGLSPQILDRA